MSHVGECDMNARSWSGGAVALSRSWARLLHKFCRALPRYCSQCRIQMIVLGGKGAKFQREVPLFLEITEFPFNTV